MDKRQLLKQFITIYFDLLNDIKSHSDNNKDFNIFYKKNYLLKNTNLKLFIRTWYANVSIPYNNQILSGDIDHLFSNKVMDDISNKTNGDIIKYMNIIKQKYNTTNNNIIDSFLLKVQQLTQISCNYFNKT
tara:strand:+ start:316 stop:708 length:393 start_codon:yes stop_codon:yes gene_type:complete